MNFYARQAQARQQTRRLVVLFALSVIVIVAAVDVVVLALLSMAEPGAMFLEGRPWLFAHPGALIATSLAVLAVILLSSLYKSAALRGGGAVVARSLGGTRVERAAGDPLRRRLFNVVEEMSIASGVPMPEIYVLEQEAGINAFAAGHSPANAAVAVTRGALENLNRAELQGVIAHEFSHVLNGDMRLNTRLIGILFGLLVVALIGRTVLRHAPRSSGRKSGGGAVVLAALAVMVLGYVGVFFGRLIQAAISRQRERLADASAVQFTREPQGLKGALVKIGASERGSTLQDPQVDEVAHMLFASGMRRMFRTHPPLEERIRALDPAFDPEEFARVRLATRTQTAAAARDDGPAPAIAGGATGLAGLVIDAAQIAQRVGNPGTPEIEAAQAMARALPQEVIGNLEAPDRALGMLLALTFDPKPQVSQLQRQVVREQLGETALQAADAAQSAVRALSALQRLPVLGEVLPALRRLPRLERTRVLACLERLTLVDGRIEVFEYALVALARTHVFDELEPTARTSPVQLAKVAVELQTVFSTLAQQCQKDPAQAYRQGMQHVLPGSRHDYQPVPGWPRALDRALKVLDRLPAPSKRLLVEALVKIIGYDGRLSANEAELLRAICATLHCPLPPLTGIVPDS